MSDDDDRVTIVNVILHGKEMWYFENDLDLSAFQILRRGAVEDAKAMTPQDKRALQRLGVDFKQLTAQQKQNRHGKLTSEYEIVETGETWDPPWKE